MAPPPMRCVSDGARDLADDATIAGQSMSACVQCVFCIIFSIWLSSLMKPGPNGKTVWSWLMICLACCIFSQLSGMVQSGMKIQAASADKKSITIPCGQQPSTSTPPQTPSQ